MLKKIFKFISFAFKYTTKFDLIQTVKVRKSDRPFNRIKFVYKPNYLCLIYKSKWD